MTGSFECPAQPPPTRERSEPNDLGVLANPKARTLRTLAEVRLYQALGHVTPEDVESAFQIVAGDDGLTMLHGSETDRLKATRKWAARAIPRTAK